MCNTNDIIVKSIELNNAIKELKEETKVINSIVEEKRAEVKEKIWNDLQKYVDIMTSLDIDVIEFKTNSCMYYYKLTRRLGIKIRRHSHGVQIDLGCMSTVANGFYAYHSIVWVASGRRDEEIMNGFCHQWSRITRELDSSFFEAVGSILEDRKEKAIAQREQAIKDLTNIY